MPAYYTAVPEIPPPLLLQLRINRCLGGAALRVQFWLMWQLKYITYLWEFHEQKTIRWFKTMSCFRPRIPRSIGSTGTPTYQGTSERHKHYLKANFMSQSSPNSDVIYNHKFTNACNLFQNHMKSHYDTQFPYDTKFRYLWHEIPLWIQLYLRFRNPNNFHQH